MKVKRIGDKQFDTIEIEDIEGLKAYFSGGSKIIEDIRFTLKGYDNIYNTNLFIVEACYPDDDGYWTVGFSNSDSFK